MLCFAVAISILIILLSLMLRRPVATRRSSGCSGRIAGPPWLPDEWNWDAVTQAQADAWSGRTNHRLPPGRYASAPMNQHAKGYCGCCFLVAAVQCVQDAYNIRDGYAVPLADKRVHHFDMQSAVNDFSAVHKTHMRELEEAGMLLHAPSQIEWNACMGGEPIEVLKALVSRRMTLKLRHGGATWDSCAQPSDQHEPDGYGIAAAEFIACDNVEALRRAVLRGPVVVAVRASALWQLRDGIPVACGNVAGADRDHVVAVVGWRVVRGERHWIVRNSWDRMVWEQPADVRKCMVSCQSETPAACQTRQVVWENDYEEPGFLLLPMDMHANCAGIYDEPTGWVELEVSPAAPGK